MNILPPGKYMKFVDDLKTLAFNVTSRAAFGARLYFPGFEEDDPRAGDKILNENHRMRFGDAAFVVVEHLKQLLIYPRWFLSMFESKERSSKTHIK